MDHLTLNTAIGALEIDGFAETTSQHDDSVLERAGRLNGGLAAEPQPFAQIGFPPPCNMARLAGRAASR